MPRRATGVVETHAWSDGSTVTYRLRVPFQGGKVRLTLGTNLQGWGPERAQAELERVMGRIARGTWEPPRRTAPDQPQASETLEQFAYRWWQEHKHEWRPKTLVDYRWRLDHLLRHHRHTQVRDIDRRTVDQLRAALGQTVGPRSTNMVLSLLARLLDVAQSYGMIDANPARGQGTRVKQPRASRSFLEPDMVRDLLDAAGQLEQAAAPRDRYGRRALLATLCLAGPRIEEALAATRGQVDLHAGLWRIPDSKTEAGVRTVELPVFLIAELRDHMAGCVLSGRASGPGDLVFPTRSGGPLNPSNVRTRTIAQAVKHANDRRAREGRLPLPTVSPHALRRTYASLLLFAGRDLPHAMANLGHADPRMTLAVYAQVLRRRNVDRGVVYELMRYLDEPDERPTERTAHHARA